MQRPLKTGELGDLQPYCLTALKTRATKNRASFRVSTSIKVVVWPLVFYVLTRTCNNMLGPVSVSLCTYKSTTPHCQLFLWSVPLTAFVSTLTDSSEMAKERFFLFLCLKVEPEYLLRTNHIIICNCRFFSVLKKQKL